MTLTENLRTGGSDLPLGTILKEIIPIKHTLNKQWDFSHILSNYV